MPNIYKIVERSAWKAALDVGSFVGAEIDLQDGYIHLSAPHQIAETLQKHFTGRHDLLLIEIDSTRFETGNSNNEQQSSEATLRWETSRNGDLFPHLYGPLDVAFVGGVYELRLEENGAHLLPSHLTVT